MREVIAEGEQCRNSYSRPFQDSSILLINFIFNGTNGSAELFLPAVLIFRSVSIGNAQSLILCVKITRN